MDKKPNTFGQPQQQQPPTSIEADLSQQAAYTPPPSGSPRRLNAPIDIDTALRLQSQASYVQEPARASPAAPALAPSGSVAQKPPASSGPNNKYHTTPANTRSSDSNTAHNSQLASTACASSQRVAYQQQHLSLSSNTNNDHYDPYAFCAKPFASNNISVDYIDCLSNNDLVASTGLPGAAAGDSSGAMRGIPSCRKHLSRFHRSHKIEPRQAAAAAASDQQEASEQKAATSGSNEEPGQPNDKSQLNDSSSLITASNSTNVTDDCSSSFDYKHQQPVGVVDGNDGVQMRASQSGVLYPISVSETKKRTYFIGSVSQDSLLSHDELHRYFPTGRVSIFVCTWNQNRKRAPMNLNDLLLPDQLVYMPDIYAIGIQEAYSSQQDYLREWEIELQTTLGPNHVLLHSCSLGALHLALFIRRDLIWFCSTPEESLYNSRSMPTNMIKTKGAISIAFRFFGTSFMFTNCHFPAHENKLRDRVDEYQRIINSIDLPKNLKLLKPRYLSNDSTARFDCVFFMGDLNFRLEHRTFDETIQILDDIFQSNEASYEALTQNDELLKVMESQQAFHGFDEQQIKFPPTYKFLAQTNKYDRQTKRVPSYTDRILFRSKRQRHIQCLVYDWLPQLLSSDHKPVYGLFDVLIRPGHERNMVGSLNAGLFQRTVYMEALKRRAEDSDGMRDNGTGGNMICSIS